MKQRGERCAFCGSILPVILSAGTQEICAACRKEHDAFLTKDGQREDRKAEGSARYGMKSDRPKLSEAIKAGDDVAVKQRLDDFADDLAEKILNAWGIKE